MKSYLQQLDNNESILLMYLAEELPPRDRAEVDQMLAFDAGLRAELTALRQTYDLGIDAMDTLDRGAPLPISQALASRQIVRLINRHKLQQRPLPATARLRRFPWWAYAVPSAAAAVLLFVLWTIYGSSSTEMPPARAAALSADDRAALLAGLFDLSSVDDSDNMKLVAVGNRADELELPDASRSSDLMAQ